MGIEAGIFVGVALFLAYYTSVRRGFWKGLGWPTPKE